MKRIGIPMVLVVVAVFATGCGWLKGGDKSPGAVRLYNDQQQRTPLGNTVASRDGANAAFIFSVDSAIHNVVEDAKAIYGNAEFLNSYGGYIIYALPESDCSLSPVYRTRSFKVNGILAAEYVPNPSVKAYVVCYTPTPDEDLRNALRYGPEHIILYAVDFPRYEQTQYPDSHQHPLLPSRP